MTSVDEIYMSVNSTSEKNPAPVPIEFLNLVEILMTENNLYMADTCEEALSLYLDLIDLIR